MTAMYRVVARWPETCDSATLRMDPEGEPLPGFVAGQFARIGRHAVPVSALPTTGGLGVTVRKAEATVYAAAVGDHLDVAGPFGTGWHLEKALGHDLLVIAHGMGLASLRPLIRDVVADPRAYGRLNLLLGAPESTALMARYETRCWATAFTGITVDRPGLDWYGGIGPVHALLARARFDPDRATVFLCAPSQLARDTGQELLRHGLPADRIVIGSLTDDRPTTPAHICTWGEADA